MIDLEYMDRDEKQASSNFGPVGSGVTKKNPVFTIKNNDLPLDEIQEEDGDIESTVRQTIGIDDKGAARFTYKENGSDDSPSTIKSKGKRKTF